MKNSLVLLLLLFNACCSAFSQVLLKKSAIKKHDNIISQYINPYVIIGYTIFFMVLLLNIIALKYCSMSIVSVFSEAVTLIISLLFGYIFFGEQITRNKTISMILIVIGIFLIIF